MGLVKRLLEFLDRQQTWAPVFLRAAIAATFIIHGYGKVFDRGASAVTEGFVKMGIPLAAQLGPLVPYVEFVGGICVGLGLLTRLAALMQSGVMVFAIAFVHFKQGYAMSAAIVDQGGKSVARAQGWEWQALLLAGCLTLFFTGAGRLSLDHLIRKKLVGPPRA